MKHPPKTLYALTLLLAGCGQPPAETREKRMAAAEPSPSEPSLPAKGSESKSPPRTAPRTAGAAYFDNVQRPALKGSLQLEKKRNSILLIVADALNAKHLSAYGYHRKTSPNIDSLAKEGILFTNHVSNSSWTRPSYTTIITGLTKAEHGVELRGGWRLEPHITTLAERFRSAGYRRAGYTGNPLVRKSWGFDQGYEVYEGPTTLGLKAFPRDKVFVNLALDWLKAVGKKPFFLSLFLTSSHPPYRPPQQPRTFLNQVAEGPIIEHPFKEYPKPLPKGDHDRIVAAYDDEIAYMDSQIGRLLDYLKQSGRARDTTVIFTADHGEMLGEHNCYLHAYHMWEGTLRVPLIITSPNLKAEGVIDETPFTHVDLAPTIMALANVPYKPDALNGLSIVREAGLKHHRNRVRFSQYNAHGVRRQAIRKAGLKLVHHHKVSPRAAKDLDELHPGVAQANPKNLPSLAWDKERYELYNIIDDPREKNDLFETRKNDEAVQELMAHISTRIGGNAPAGEINPELLKALQAAGYIVSEQN
jgi:arylsulfatase A-like enzyme